MQTTKQARGTFISPSTFTTCLLAIQVIKQARQTSTFWHFYGLLYELSNRSDGLLSSGTFTTCSIIKHQKDLMDFSILWNLTALPFAISLGWVMTINMDFIPPRSRTAFVLYASSVWSADIIATFVSIQLGDKILWVWQWDWHVQTVV